MAYGVCSSLGQYQVVVQDVLQRICTVHHHNLFSMVYLQLGSSGTLLIVLRKLIAIQMWCLHANFCLQMWQQWHQQEAQPFVVLIFSVDLDCFCMCRCTWSKDQE